MNSVVAVPAGADGAAARAEAWMRDQGLEPTRVRAGAHEIVCSGDVASTEPTRHYLGPTTATPPTLDRVPPGGYLVDGAEIAAGPTQRLFVHVSPTGPVVASHLAAAAAAVGTDVKVDRSFEDFLLGFGFLPDGRTVFDGVVATAPGARVRLTDGVISVPEAPTAQVWSGPIPDIAELVCEVLDEQAGAARTVGVLLGGFDSALVAAALARTGREVHTFTFAFSEPGYAQRHVAETVAASGSTHHDVLFTPERLGDALVALPRRLNQPSPQPHYQLQTIIAAEEAAAAGAEMIFTGDGCDALFAAYPTINTRAAAGGVLGRVPGPLRTAMLRGASVGVVEQRLGHVARVARSAIRASRLEGPAARHLPTQYLDDVALDRLRQGDRPTQRESIEAVRLRLAEQSGLTDPARLAVHGNTLTGQSSSKVEGAMARTGLTVASPYTHPRFRAAIAALPEDQQRPEGNLARAEGKPVLQRAAVQSGLLPETVVYQAKQSPTEAPVDEWYRGPLRPVIEDLWRGLPFEPDPTYLDLILRPKRAEEMYRRRLAISKHAYQAIGLVSSYASFTRMVT